MGEQIAMTNSQQTVSSLQQLVQSVVAGAEKLLSWVRKVISDEQFQQAMRAIAAGVERMTYWEWVEKACAHSGFLPYRTVPFDEFYRENKDNYDLFSSRVSEYYEDHEEDILQNIESYLKTLKDVDVDRKATIQEAIMNHRDGRFRLTTRALLPDIERIILEDWMGNEKEKVQSLGEGMLHEVINKKNLEDFAPDNIYDLRLFGYLINVLYKNGSKRKEFQGENFPNRHAALHGWILYSTREDSLNIIIFADYILRLVPLFKGSKV